MGFIKKIIHAPKERKRKGKRKRKRKRKPRNSKKMSPAGKDPLRRADAHYKWAARYAGFGDEARSLSHLRSAARYRATAFGTMEPEPGDSDLDPKSIMEDLRERARPFEDKIPTELFEHILKRNGPISGWLLFNAYYAKQAYADIKDAISAVASKDGDFDTFFAKLKARDAKAAADKEQKRAKEKADEQANELFLYNISHSRIGGQSASLS